MFTPKKTSNTISISEIKGLAEDGYGDMVKAVIDIQSETIVWNTEMHVDAEQILLSEGSLQADLWGFNIYPDASEGNFIEFDSMINIRPKQGNRSRYVESQEIRDKILEILKRKII